MKDYKYFRIHTDQNAYITAQPRGLFTAIGRLVDSKIMDEDEIEVYWQNRHWFEEHLPVPPFYEDGNSIKAISWYKNNEKARSMFDRMSFYVDMAHKYQLKLWITQSKNDPGKIVYEDEYQIAVVDSKHSGPGFESKSYDP